MHIGRSSGKLRFFVVVEKSKFFWNWITDPSLPTKFSMLISPLWPTMSTIGEHSYCHGNLFLKPASIQFCCMFSKIAHFHLLIANVAISIDSSVCWITSAPLHAFEGDRAVNIVCLHCESERGRKLSSALVFASSFYCILKFHSIHSCSHSKLHWRRCLVGT